MQKQMGQIVKFSLTGVICTVIDYVCYSICLRLGIPYLWAGVIGFAVSVTANYFLSMRYVFVPREDCHSPRLLSRSQGGQTEKDRVY